MITLYHRTNKDVATQIIANGFRDSEGYYGTESLHRGVWLSDRALDANEGAVGTTVLRVELTKDEPEIADFEWIEEGKPYREWLIPVGERFEGSDITKAFEAGPIVISHEA